MESAEPFVDYYDLLQVSPGCDETMLEKAYRHFAQKYHPDHAETADVEKFQEIIAAYKVLRDPEQRTKYNERYKRERLNGFAFIPQDEDIRIDEKDAVADAELHEKILFFLYKRRREHPDQPGVLSYHVQGLVNCSDEGFEFHIWYLKSKGFLEITQQSELAITIEGVDHVIAMSRTREERKLLTNEDAPRPMRREGG